MSAHEVTFWPVQQRPGQVLQNGDAVETVCCECPWCGPGDADKRPTSLIYMSVSRCSWHCLRCARGGRVRWREGIGDTAEIEEVALA